MVYTILLILLWPLVIFLCYKFILLNINELESNKLQQDTNHKEKQ